MYFGFGFSFWGVLDFSILVGYWLLFAGGFALWGLPTCILGGYGCFSFALGLW